MDEEDAEEMLIDGDNDFGETQSLCKAYRVRTNMLKNEPERKRSQSLTNMIDLQNNLRQINPLLQLSSPISRRAEVVPDLVSPECQFLELL